MSQLRNSSLHLDVLGEDLEGADCVPHEDDHDGGDDEEDDEDRDAHHVLLVDVSQLVLYEHVHADPELELETKAK